MNETNAAASTAALLGHTGDWWDFWMICSLAAAAFIAFFIVFFTAGSVMVHKREAAAASAELERYKLQAEREAATLRKQTEDEATARVKLEKEVAWRRVSAQDAEAIRRSIPASFAQLRIEVRHMLSDPEASTYASEIADALRPALKVDGTKGVLEPWGTIPLGVGLYISRQDIPGAVEIQRALKAGGIEAPGALLSMTNLSSDTGIVIFVWPKPSPKTE
jgi:hypothetical protein